MVLGDAFRGLFKIDAGIFTLDVVPGGVAIGLGMPVGAGVPELLGVGVGVGFTVAVGLGVGVLVDGTPAPGEVDWLLFPGEDGWDGGGTIIGSPIVNVLGTFAAAENRLLAAADATTVQLPGE